MAAGGADFSFDILLSDYSLIGVLMNVLIFGASGMVSQDVLRESLLAADVERAVMLESADIYALAQRSAHA